MLRQPETAATLPSEIRHGTFVQIGERRLEAIWGGSEGPAVVFDSGLCTPMQSWGHVPATVARFTQVLAYNRAGIGRSEAAEGPRTSREMVEELRALLHAVGLCPPYVLVGHSFGGLNVQLFARLYPHEVAGLVLVDAMTETQYSSWMKLSPAEHKEALRRRFGGANPERVDCLASSHETRQAPLPVDLPVAILTRTYGGGGGTLPGIAAEQIEENWSAEQQRLAQRFPRATHVIAERSGHYIQLDEASLVIDAIHSVVRAACGSTETYQPGVAVPSVPSAARWSETPELAQRTS